MNTDNRKREVEKAREEFKNKGFYKFFVEPEIKFWKEKPFQAFGLFFFWMCIYYLLFSGLQAINYSLIYCDSTTHEGYNGRIMEIKPQWDNLLTHDFMIKYPTFNESTSNIKQISQDFKLETENKYILKCDYNFELYLKEGIQENIKYTLNTWKKVILKQ